MVPDRIIRIKNLPLHLILWVGTWFFFYWFFSYNSTDIRYVTWFSSLLLPLTMAVTYFVIYYLIPRFLLTKKYGRFALFSFYTLIASSYLIVLIIYGCLFLILDFEARNIPPMIKNFTFIVILVYLIVGFVSFIYILNHNFQTQKKYRDLQQKILETQLQLKEQELHYLKKQIHPHFLFNTLNTIYAFALKQSEQTPDIILKLSNLLDYILYQVDKPVVSLADEITHIREYIDLEHIRFRETLDVSYTFPETPGDMEIAPMLLIPFVENAFKHGSSVDGKLLIRGGIEIKEKTLRFELRNSYIEREKAKTTAGIGLQNAIKRLDLNYGTGYDLETDTANNWYTVVLNIDLTKLSRDAAED